MRKDYTTLKLLLRLISPLLVFFLLLAINGTAFAAPRIANVTCSGQGCNGTWPDQTHCADDAITVLSANINTTTSTVGKVELRWSPTCQTNWARVTSYIGTIGLIGMVQRDNGPDGSYLCYDNPHPGLCNSSSPWINATVLFTQQVYAPNNNASASGIIVQGSFSWFGCVANPGWFC